MTPRTPSAFISYAHADDAAEDGRIAALARDLATEFNLKTGTQLAVFLDRDSIAWGRDWSDRIETALRHTAFFVPIVTPRYFQRSECRRELALFAQVAQDLGVSELVLPLLYADVPALHAVDVVDDAVLLIRRYQWFDWRMLRLEDRLSAAYRKGVAALAVHLVAALTEVTGPRQDTVAVRTVAPRTVSSIRAALGSSERTVRHWQGVVAEARAPMARLTELLATFASDVDADADGVESPTMHLQAAARIAQQLDDPVARVAGLGRDHAAALIAVDAALRVLGHEMAGDALTSHDAQRTQRCVAEIRGLIAADRETTSALRSLSERLAYLSRRWRLLRPASRSLATGVRGFTDAGVLYGDWERTGVLARHSLDRDSTPRSGGAVSDRGHRGHAERTGSG